MQKTITQTKRQQNKNKAVRNGRTVQRFRGAGFPEGKVFLLMLAVCLGICVIDGIYPFGENCMLHVDMYHQYCPFFTEFRRKLVSGESLMYSFRIGLGSDFVSVFVYYLSSPLNWLLVLCPEKLIIEFMTALIMIKMALAGAAFCYFLRKRFGEEEFPVLLVFSAAYALCGFMTAYNWDIMWLDSVALAPIIFLGLYRLVKEGRSGLYYTSLALSILCNYYISIMICIFLVFDFGYHFFTIRELKPYERLKMLLRFCWYSLLAGGTGIVLILPELLILSYSGSSGISFPDKTELYYNLLAQGARFSAGASIYTGNDHWPNLYTGVFAVLLFFCYCMNKAIARREKWLHILMVLFLYVSFAVNVLDWFWHGLHYPDSLPGRQSFLLAFLLLVMGYRAWKEREALSAGQIIAAASLAIVLLAAGIITCPDKVTEKAAGISSCGLILLYSLSLLWDRRYAILPETGWRKEIPEEMISAIVSQAVLILAIGELVVNMAVAGFYTTSRTRYLSRMESYQTLLELAEADAAEEEENSGSRVFYRVENTERKCKNDDCLYGYPSATQFSSLMNVNVSHFFQSLFMEGGKNFYCYNGATPISSAMLSVKYMISDNPYEESFLRTLVGEADGNYLYKNLYTAPLGFVLSEQAVRDWEEWEEKKIPAINRLAQILGADTDLLVPYACRMEAKEGNTKLYIPAQGYYYAASRKCEADTLTFVYEDPKEITYSKTTHRYLFDLGMCEDESVITVKNTASKTVEFDVYRLNRQAAEQAFSTLVNETMELTDYSDTKIEGSVDLKEAGRLILSIPAESGWKLLVDGRNAEVLPFDETFISVPLEAGRHDIVLTYETPGLKAGAAASLLCVTLALLTLARRRRMQ